MKKVLFFQFAFLFLIQATGYSAEIKTGNISLYIPAPKGFVAISDSLPEIFKLYQNMLPPGLQAKEVFLPIEDVANLMNGAFYLPNRFSSVGVKKELEGKSFSMALFSESIVKLREELLKQSNDSKDKLEELKGLVNDRIIKEYKGQLVSVDDVALIGNTIQESSKSISFSALKKVHISDVSFVNVQTGTTALVKNQIIFLSIGSVYQNDSDLKWTQDQTNNWLKDIWDINSETIIFKGGE